MVRFTLRIVTFCPPALAIQDMGPEASTLPPPVTLPGLKLFGALPFYQHLQRLASQTERLRVQKHFLFDPNGFDIWRVRMRKIITCLALAGAVLVSACNTIEGVGRDVSSAGDTVAKTADDAK